MIFSKFEIEHLCIFVDDSKQGYSIFGAFCSDSVNNGICIKNYSQRKKNKRKRGIHDDFIHFSVIRFVEICEQWKEIR